MPLSLCRLSFILNSSHDIEQKPFLAWPPLAWTPFKKRNTKMFAEHSSHSSMTLRHLTNLVKNPLILARLHTCCYLIFLIFSYFFSFCNVGVILFFLIFSYVFLFFLIFSYFFLFFLISSYFLFDQAILFFLIFSYFFLFSLIFSYFFSNKKK